MTGYASPLYADSLREFGTPLRLSRSCSWILERLIPGLPYRDAMGCYPLFMSEDWSCLEADFSELEEKLVTLAVVTDPFGNYNLSMLQNYFNYLVKPFKEHFVIDLSKNMKTVTQNNHMRNARKALRVIKVELCQHPIELLNDWVDLYDVLIARHQLKDIRAFSRAAFAKQLQVPGIVAFRAVHNDETVGMTLWYKKDDVGYYHLGAYSETGYNLKASFALFHVAIEYFRNELKWLDLGGSAGIAENKNDGLARFKRGWSTGTRTAFFCGHIFDRRTYSAIVPAEKSSTAYFPAYREGEFGEKAVSSNDSSIFCEEAEIHSGGVR